MSTLQNQIRTAYSDCLQLSRQHQQGFGNLLEQAFEAAQVGERQHRKHQGGRWRVSVLNAAQYFAVKWFLDQTKGPESWAAACSVRDDVRLALGARDTCPKAELRKLRKLHAAVLAIDYAEQMAPRREQ